MHARRSRARSEAKPSVGGYARPDIGPRADVPRGRVRPLDP